MTMFYKACQNYAEGKVCVWWFKNHSFLGTM